ncbi:TPA: hypothetical protein DDZ10_01365 [Candidatus Uhrbacteria bacterium]|nr:hypothetical protein [Candidatus Uhrbacteria bacterium]
MRAVVTTLRHHKYVAGIVLLMVVSVLASWLLADEIRLADVSALEAFLERLGVWGPVALIAFVTIEVVIAPIPGGVPPIVAGALYGFEGFLYVWMGNIIGSSIAFWLARWLGIGLVRRLDPKFDERGYLEQVRRLWFFYFIPLMPVDILSFAFGLSRVRFRLFFAVSSIGFFVSMGLLTLFGDSLARLIF